MKINSRFIKLVNVELVKIRFGGESVLFRRWKNANASGCNYLGLFSDYS